MGFSIVYKKLIFKGIKKAFRITCIMLILKILNLLILQIKPYALHFSSSFLSKLLEKKDSISAGTLILDA